MAPRSIGPDSPEPTPSLIPAPDASRLGLPPVLGECWAQISHVLGLGHDNDAGSEIGHLLRLCSASTGQSRSLTQDLEDEHQSFPGAERPVDEETQAGLDLDNAPWSFPVVEMSVSLREMS